MDTLRKPFFVAALILAAVVVLVELGALGFLAAPTAQAASLAALIPPGGELADAYAELDPAEVQRVLNQDKPPGLAVPALALVDGILLLTLGLMAVSLLIGEHLHGRIQGITTLVVALLLLLAALSLILTVALPKLLLMVALFLATPFGTIAYLAVYGFFNRGGASVTLGLLMALKLGMVVCLVVAQQKMLQIRGLVLLILTSLLAGVIVSLLHGIVPGFLVSITDALAALIVAILAAIWAIFLLLFSVGSVLRALRPS